MSNFWPKVGSDELLRVWAIDPDNEVFDDKTDIEYTLTGSSFFEMTSDGFIKVRNEAAKSLLNFESIETPVIMIATARERNTFKETRKQVEINLIPVNEFLPVFQSNTYTRRFPESRSGREREILRVQANDADKPNHPHSNVTYAIDSVTSGGRSKFKIAIGHI